MKLIPWRRKHEGRENEPGSESSLTRLRSDIDDVFDRFFEGFWGESELSRPSAFGFGTRVDLSESDDAVTVTADLPGVEANDVDISMEGNTLVIRGVKKEEREEEKRNYHFVERQFGSFHRTIPLPTTVDPDKVDATFKNGVLTVTVAKRPEAKPKQIEVKSE